MGIEIDPNTGLLTTAAYIASPNANQRPPGSVIDLLVIHNISLPAGEFGTGYIEELFTNQLAKHAHPSFVELADLRVSAHILIDRQGMITQFVPFSQRAWHAGESCFEGRENCNDYSIGIELEGTDTQAYTDKQYAALVDLTRAILSVYPAINPQRIVGHCDIAPTRKTDPGKAFDWDYYVAKLTEQNV